MSDKPEGVQLLEQMRQKGIEQHLPGTDRIVRLRTLDAPALLREGKMPDILTPLVVKSIYRDLSDQELRDFLNSPQEKASLDPEDALAFLETINFVCRRAIMDETSLDDLTLAEKRWIFRLVMTPAEILTTFRYEPELDVEDLVESEDLQPVAEPSL